MDAEYKVDQTTAGSHETQMPDTLALSSRRSDDLLIIALTGELDFKNVKLLDQAIREAEEEDGEAIFLDLRELRFIDSVGLQALLVARHRSDRIRLVRSNHDQVSRVIALTGTDEVLGYPLADESAG